MTQAQIARIHTEVGEERGKSNRSNRKPPRAKQENHFGRVCPHKQQEEYHETQDLDRHWEKCKNPPPSHFFSKPQTPARQQVIANQ